MKNIGNKIGISLIVLIVTIIVVIILAAVVVLTLSKNNPINSSKEATFREDIYNFKTELELYKAKISRNGEDVTKLYASKDSDPNITDVISSMPKKYIDKLEVREGKLLYVGKDREEYLQSRDMNLLPEDELLDDDILTELKPFITEWTVEAGDSITLPISGTCNFTVDYGDGTGKYSVTSATDEDRIHIYENAGTYTVVIEGSVQLFCFNNSNISKSKLTKIVQWGDINISGINFYGCNNLKGNIPEPSKNSFKKVNGFNCLFTDCLNLDCEIPERLFKNCHNVTTFYYAFKGCKVKSIPENLFKDCENVTSFQCTFADNYNLKGTIPKNLFQNCIKVKNFENVFWNCRSITGNIPKELFWNCPNVESFGSAFAWCTSLDGEISSELFNNNLQVKNFVNTFYGCSRLKGNAQALWNRDNVESFSRCFYDCKKLSNYSEIPDDWK